VTHIIRIELSGERKHVRDTLIHKFLEEPQGSGDYRYIVENTPNGDVEIIRPTRLNKGVDFAVQLRDFEFRLFKSNGHRLAVADKCRPKHDDILAILDKLKEASPTYDLVRITINEIYEKSDADYALLDGIQIFHDLAQKPISAHAVCAIIKWLFIEQDVTYWTGLGRTMFYESIKLRGLL
jgi:hypothetical protein